MKQINSRPTLQNRVTVTVTSGVTVDVLLTLWVRAFKNRLEDRFEVI